MDLFGVVLWVFLEWSQVNNSRKAEKSYMLYIDCLIASGLERITFFSPLMHVETFCCLPSFDANNSWKLYAQ